MSSGSLMMMRSKHVFFASRQLLQLSSLVCLLLSTAAAIILGEQEQLGHHSGIFPIIMPRVFPARNEVYLCTMVDVEVSR